MEVEVSTAQGPGLMAVGEAAVQGCRLQTPTGALEVGVVSACGPVREENEDTAAVWTGEGGEVIAVVADGMGGHACGREAAEIVVRTCVEAVRRCGEETWEDALRAALAAAHREVRKAASARRLEGMGATALVAAVESGGVFPVLHLAHVGDSRAYLARGRSLYRLTADHSLVAQLVRDGHLTEEEAHQHPDRNVIQRAIGQQAPLEPEAHAPVPLQGGDCLLLCSDGVHGALSDGEMLAALEPGGTAADTCQRLLDAALAAESEDNLSVACIRVAERGKRPRPTRVGG
jgi:PPM family protein phosphatase